MGKTIGVFDSGVGGLSVANALEKAYPDATIIFKNDSKNVPYGSKAPEVLLELVTPILEKMAEDCDIIVIACNTVSTTLIKPLREKIKVPLIAFEPMVKPAALQTKSGIIAVCATPTTLASTRYNELKREYAHDVKVLEPDCSDWSYMIENKQVDRAKIQERIERVCEEGADVIVLACTHYHWIEELIKEIAANRAVVLQPEQAIVRQVDRILKSAEESTKL